MMDLITRLMIAVVSLFKKKNKMTYEKYCEDMKRLGHGPMDIKEFEKMIDQEKDPVKEQDDGSALIALEIPPDLLADPEVNEDEEKKKKVEASDEDDSDESTDEDTVNNTDENTDEETDNTGDGENNSVVTINVDDYIVK